MNTDERARDAVLNAIYSAGPLLDAASDDDLEQLASNVIIELRNNGIELFEAAPTPVVHETEVRLRRRGLGGFGSGVSS